MLAPVRSRGRIGRATLGCQPDSRLVALVRDGSDRAFEEIVRRYRRRLVAYAAAIVGPDRAEDVVQESLVRALAALRRRDGEVSLRPWLYTIVRNRALNDRRDEPAHELLDEGYDGVPQPPEIAARREELASVVDRVKALPEAQREALVQRELEGRSHEEIAVALTVTPGAVRGLIFRARSALRDAAGLLIPMPVLRAFAESSAVSDGGAVVAAAGGGGGLVKLGMALTFAAVTVGGGVALHDHGGKGSEAKADPAPATRSHASHGARRPNDAGGAQTVALAGRSEATEDRGDGTGGDRDSGSGGPGPGGSGSSGPGPSSSGHGSGSSGPGPAGSGTDGPGSGGSGSSSSGPGGSGSSGGGGSADEGGSGSRSGPGSGSSPGSGGGDTGSSSGPGGGGGSDGGSSGSDGLVSSEGNGSPTTTTTATTTTTTDVSSEGPGGGSLSGDGGSSGSGSGSGSSGSG